jgi:hypothetical protein
VHKIIDVTNSLVQHALHFLPANLFQFREEQQMFFDSQFLEENILEAMVDRARRSHEHCLYMLWTPAETASNFVHVRVNVVIVDARRA